MKNTSLSLLMIVISLFIGQRIIADDNQSKSNYLTKESFKNPSMQYRPKPLWFWNDTTVTHTGIEEQMTAFVNQCGYGGFSILPFGKKFKPEYLSEEYFEVYKTAINKAKDLGVYLDIYDEYGFPSGSGGAINGDDTPRFMNKYPDHTIKRLDKLEKEVTGPSQFHLALPDTGIIEGVVAMNIETQERINISSLIKGSSLDWNAPKGNWKVMCFYIVKDGDPNVDYLDAESVKKYISMTQEQYYKRFGEHFGKTVIGTFFDEITMYRAQGRIWTAKYRAQFQNRYGFDPIIYYPALWYDIGKETVAARNYLFGFRTQLFAESYPKESSEWAKAHNVKATGHQDNEEVVNPVNTSGDLMKCFKYQEIPGIDKIGGNRPAEKFLKIVSSAAYNWDNHLIMSETYGDMGNISWNEIFSIAMDQYSKGINVLIPHAVWYNDKTRGVFFLPELSHRNPIYQDSLPVFNQYLSRLNLVLQNEDRVIADVGVLYPIAAMQAGNYLDGPLGHYKGGVEIPDMDYLEVSRLLSNEIGLDHIYLHPEVLSERCIIKDKQLIMPYKKESISMKVLIIPSALVINIDNLEKIKAFYDLGGTIIFTTQLPERAAQFNKDSRVREIMAEILPNGISSANNKGGKIFFVQQPNKSTLLSALKYSGQTYDVNFPSEQVLHYIHKKGKNDVYFFANPISTAFDGQVIIKGTKKLELWNPHTGEISKAKYKLQDINGEQCTVVDLHVDPIKSIFLKVI
ncbi:glycosyl hydrolase [Dysgonomonas sp. ZJ709]|uniref:glycosyl hydrolase n=1 Tax=Dysgonomonas sp. ZJ709 TaxID=2709797 RepID=UPI00210791E6|nr:glycosyl hydrolase [Dysgonomonas sp. ZJ709]